MGTGCCVYESFRCGYHRVARKRENEAWQLLRLRVSRYSSTIDKLHVVRVSIFARSSTSQQGFLCTVDRQGAGKDVPRDYECCSTETSVRVSQLTAAVAPHLNLNTQVSVQFKLTAVATSNRKVELIPYNNVKIGSQVFVDRDYVFKSVSDYPADTVFLRISNSDKSTQSDKVQL